MKESILGHRNEAQGLKKLTKNLINCQQPQILQHPRHLPHMKYDKFGLQLSFMGEVHDKNTRGRKEQQTILKLAQKLVKNLSGRIIQNEKQMQIHYVISVDPVLLRNIQHLKLALSKLPQENSILQHNQLLRKSKQNQKPNGQSLIYKLQQQKESFRRQLNRIIQSALNTRCQDKTIVQLLSDVRRLCGKCDKLNKEKVGLIQQNRRIRFHYNSMIQNYKQELKFMHQILIERDQQLSSLSLQIRSMHKPFFTLKEQPCLISEQESQMPIVSIDTFKHSSSIKKMFQSIKLSESSVDQIEIEATSQGQYAPRLVSNPESDRKNKQKQESKDNQQMKQKQINKLEQIRLQSQIINSNNEKIKDNIINLQRQKQQKQNCLQALADEISLMTDNVTVINEQCQKVNQYLTQKQQLLQKLNDQLQKKNDELANIQSSIQQLREEKILEEEHLQLIQQQYEFTLQQCEIINAEVENQRNFMKKAVIDPYNQTN